MWKLFPAQSVQARSILRANKRLNIWDGSIRSGKTVASLIAWYIFICKNKNKNNGLYLITGVTIETIEKNILIPFSDWIGEDALFSYSIGRRKAVLNDGTISVNIHLVGGNDEKSQRRVRGSTIFCCYCDEISLYPESFWMMVLRGLSVPGAKLFGTTNPDTPSHYLKKNFLDKQDKIDLQYFHFTLKDNDFLTDDYKRNIQSEFTGLWYKRFILGLWVAATGAIYDMFSDEHIIDTTPFIEQCNEFYISIDYGIKNPCTFGFYGRIVDKLFLFCEYYWDSSAEGYQKTDYQYADDLEKFIAENLPTNKKINRIFIDPSAASMRREIENRGLPVVAANNDVTLGIRAVSSQLMKKNFLIDKTCEHTKREYFSYVWDSTNGREQPMKKNDHSCDRDRYLILSLLENNQIIEWEPIYGYNDNEY